MNLRRTLVRTALAVTLTVTAALALDRIFPPNLTRYLDRSWYRARSGGNIRSSASAATAIEAAASAEMLRMRRRFIVTWARYLGAIVTAPIAVRP